MMKKLTCFLAILFSFCSLNLQSQCASLASAFNLSPSSGCTAPLTVFFTDQSVVPDTWYWQFGDGGTSTAQNPIHSYTTTGTFVVSLTISDTNFGCTSVSSQNVVIGPPSATATVTSGISCNGDNDGQVTASATGGTGSYTYSWNTGGTSALETGLGAGTYSVTVTDASGCTGLASVTLTNPTNLIASASVNSPIECNGDNNGQVSASATGGTGSYTYSWNTGGTSALETGLGAGTYSVTVTDQNGCTDSASVTMTNPTNLIASASVSSSLDCNGDNDGQVSASSTGGTGSYTYSWNTGGTSAVETGLGAGTYSVTVTDANGCTDNATVSITEPTVLVSSATLNNNVSCNGASDGEATSSATGGTGSYTYSWSNSATTAMITGVSGNTYSVTITDANGCSDSASVIISEPVSLISTATLDANVSCNGLSNGGATASATGGTGSYTYSWNTGGTSALETGLGAGTYSVTVTDANGCTDSASVALPNPASLIASASVNSPIDCNGENNGQVTASATGGTGSYTYSWNTGGTSALETSLGAGTYSVTVTDQNGCTDSASVTMTNPTILIASVSVSSSLDCNGDNDGQVTAAATGGTGSYTYSWNTGGTSALETGLGAGTYSVTVTDANGCTDSASVSLTQPTAVVASAAVTSALDCGGDTDGQVTASATGGTGSYTYTWNTGGTSALETGLGAGTYSVTVTDANGCTDSATVSITEPTVLVSSATLNNNVSCNGASDGEATSSATGGTGSYTYSWSNSATTAMITGVSGNTYSVTITDANGCSDSASVIISEPDSLISTATLDANVSCNGLSNGGATASATGGTGSYTYSWSTGGTSAAVSGLGTATYSVTITDANGCTDSSSVVISEPDALISSAVVDSTVSCNGLSDGQATSSATGGTLPYTYLWSNTQTTATANNLSAGTYSVTITDNNACTDSSSVIIIEEDMTDPVVSCPGDITVNNEIGVCGAVVSYTVNSSDNCSGETLTQTAGLASGSTFPIGITMNTFVAIDAFGNADTCSFEVEVIDAESPQITCRQDTTVSSEDGSCTAIVTFADPTFSDNCAGATIAQTAGLASGAVFPPGITVNTYVVTDASGNTATCSFEVIVSDTQAPEITCPASISQCDPLVEYDDPVAGDNCLVEIITQSDLSGLTSGSSFPVGTTTLTYTVRDASSNEKSCSFDVTIFDPPTVDLGADLSTTDIAPVQLEAVLSNDLTFEWSPSNSIDDPFSLTPMASPTETTTYSLVVVSPDGCEATDSITVNVTPVNDLVIATLFTPNGDGRNDFWEVNKPALLEACQVAVFNRWGNLVFESEGYNDSWDGTYKGVPLPEGTYYYVIKCNGQELSGPINLIRLKR